MFLIQLANVNVYLPEGKPLLRDLNFGIAKGEWISLVGKNGCGKSLLGKLLAGLDIQYDGVILPSENSSFQLVLQNPESQLVGETVWEDICFGLEAHGVAPELITAKAASALKRVGLSGFEQRPVHTLSGGQKQLLAIAGAIVLEPSLIIADEVTSMLDPTSRTNVLRVLRELNRDGLTILMITQLLEELAYADRLIVLDNGTVVYDGDKERFFYNGIHGGASVCEQVGLEPPYTVKVAKRMLDCGMNLRGFPVSPEELLEAVALP